MLGKGGGAEGQATNALGHLLSLGTWDHVQSSFWKLINPSCCRRGHLGWAGGGPVPGVGGFMVLGGWEGGGRRENKGKKRERDSKTRTQSNGGRGGEREEGGGRGRKSA